MARDSSKPYRPCLLLMALFAPALAASADQLPLDYFTRHDDFGEIRISPDGSYFAASMIDKNEGGLVFYTIQPVKAVAGLRAGEGNLVDEFHWASPTRLIFTTAQRQIGLMVPVPTGEILGVDRDASQQVYLYGYRAYAASKFRTVDTRLPQGEADYGSAEIVDELDDDDRAILICEHPWKQTGQVLRYDPDAAPTLTSLDIYSAKRNVIERLPLGNAWPLLDDKHVARFAVGYDKEGHFAAMWKPEHEWTELQLPGFREHTVIPQHFTPDHRAVLFIGTRTDESLSALYRLDLESRNVEKVYGHPEADIDRVVTDLADETVVGVRVYADRPEYHWIDPDSPTAKLYEIMQRAFPGQSVQITSATRDQLHAIAFVSSDVNPGDYYLIDTKNRKADFLVPSRSWVDPARMRHKDIVKINARDGLVLHGYLTRPRDEPGPYPLVVLPHGGPIGIRDDWSFDWEAQLLAAYGYAVLQVNFRGSGGYGEDFNHAGYHEWGGKMQDDVTDATLWAIEQKIADKDNICIYGASYGGYAALMGAVREPTLYRCAASYAGVTDLQLMFKKGDIRFSNVGRTYLQESLGEDVDDLRKRSPVYHAEAIQIPVLIVHGKEDWRADFEHATRMRDALEKAHKDVQFVALSFEGHGAYDEETRVQVYGKLLDFLAQHLRGGQAYSQN